MPMRKKKGKGPTPPKNVQNKKLGSCMFGDYASDGRVTKIRTCNKAPVCVIRARGHEYEVCKQHRTEGVFVRNI